MGIKKFTSTFIEQLTDYSQLAFREVEAVFIDGNQFIYGVVDGLRKRATKASTDLYVLEDVHDDVSFWTLV